MIRINLLPAELEAAPSSRINPAIPLAASVIIPALILIPLHLNQMATRKRLQTESASLKSELERYQPIIAQVEALEAAKVQLTQRKSVIQQLESERLRYPQFLDDFLKLIPNNLWLTNLVTTSPTNSNVLTVSMDVIALDNYAIADLIANLETSQIFTEVDLGSISASQTPTGQTMAFHVNTSYKKADITPNAIKKS
jgi:Tfp pilus assembly protein PilN